MYNQYKPVGMKLEIFPARIDSTTTDILIYTIESASFLSQTYNL